MRKSLSAYNAWDILGFMIIPVILCGGAGSRLWPLSRKSKPKQFLKLFGGKSLLTQTAERTIECSGVHPSTLMAVTSENLKAKTLRHLPHHTEHVLEEPEAKNTAAAIAMAAGYVDRTFGANSILWVMPSDHIITDHNALKQAVHHAYLAALDGYLATFGIRASYHETGYGYIRLGNLMKDSVYNIEKFHEKPDTMIAKRYLKDERFVWNSGMFMFKTSVIIREFEKLAPEYNEILKGQYDGYSDLPNVPFDRAVMEKTDRGSVIPCDIGWSDIGTWRNLLRKTISTNKHAA